MAFKFNEITFDLKDLILICGFVAMYYDFKSDQKEQLNDFKNEMKLAIAKVVNDNNIQEIKFNARFDMLNRPTSQKTDTVPTFKFTAIIPERKINLINKKEFKTELV